LETLAKFCQERQTQIAHSMANIPIGEHKKKEEEKFLHCQNLLSFFHQIISKKEKRISKE
jgi:hypothetical protein